MDPPPNAPRSPNGRDFAARAEGERMVLKNTPMGRAPQVKREMREEDASSGGGPATATRSGQAKRAARAGRQIGFHKVWSRKRFASSSWMSISGR